MLNVLLVLSLLGLAFGFMQLRQAPQKAKPLVYALLVVVLILVVLKLTGGCSRQAVPFNDDFHSAVGFKLGEEVAKSIPAGSEVLVVHSGRFVPSMTEVLDAQIEGLKRGFGSASYTLVESGPEEGSDELMLMMEDPLIRMSAFVKRLEGHPNAKAVVSFIGAPVLEPGVPVPPLPPLFALGSTDPAMARPLLSRGILRAGVFYKASIDWDAKPTPDMSIDDIFNLRYELITSNR